MCPRATRLASSFKREHTLTRSCVRARARARVCVCVRFQQMLVGVMMTIVILGFGLTQLGRRQRKQAVLREHARTTTPRSADSVGPSSGLLPPVRASSAVVESGGAGGSTKSSSGGVKRSSSYRARSHRRGRRAMSSGGSGPAPVAIKRSNTGTSSSTGRRTPASAQGSGPVPVVGSVSHRVLGAGAEALL